MGKLHAFGEKQGSGKKIIRAGLPPGLRSIWPLPMTSHSSWVVINSWGSKLAGLYQVPALTVLRQVSLVLSS